MSKKFIVGNWKMNKTISESVELAKSIVTAVSSDSINEVVVCPTSISLSGVKSVIKESSVKLGAQNMHNEESGAFTGEISPSMVSEICDYVILGHSERRSIFNETDELINKKVIAAHKHGIKPIFCFGENLEENESGKTQSVLTDQIVKGLAGLTKEEIENTLIAYEPVWAIGTGKTADPVSVNKLIDDIIHPAVMSLGQSVEIESINVLYGGSIKPDNAKSFLDQPNIDGVLIGGASLDPNGFAVIANNN